MPSEVDQLLDSKKNYSMELAQIIGNKNNSPLEKEVTKY